MWLRDGNVWHWDTVPERNKLGAWLKSLASGVWPREREGRKRILPGQDNRNLGAGWHEAKRL